MTDSTIISVRRSPSFRMSLVEIAPAMKATVPLVA
jgi:hypothetical protein